MSNLSPMRLMRIVLSVFLAVSALTVLISYNLEEPDLETAVATALAADDRLIEVALEQYPEQGPAIVVTYGQLPLFKEQLARFGPQVMPIVAAYQQSFTTVDALQLAQEAGQALVDRLASWFTVMQLLAAPDINEEETGPEKDTGELDDLSPDDRGLIASLLDRIANWSQHAESFEAPAAGPPEIARDNADSIEAQVAPAKDVRELNGSSPKDRGLVARIVDWFASWFTPEQPPLARTTNAPVIAGEVANPPGEQTAAENDWLPSWLTPEPQVEEPPANAPEAAPTRDNEKTSAENHAVELGGLSEEERGLLALFNMREKGNVFVGQWNINPGHEAVRIPSRVVMLEGPELVAGGLTALERRIFQEEEIDWKTYVEAAVDVAALASGVTLLRFAKTAGRATRAPRVPAGIPSLRPGGLEAAKATAKVLGIKAVSYGLPVGLLVLMVLHPGVFTQYLWLLAESLGMWGIMGPLIGWGIVIVPLAFLLSWMLLSVRVLRSATWLFVGAARGCRRLTVRLAMPDRG